VGCLVFGVVIVACNAKLPRTNIKAPSSPDLSIQDACKNARLSFPPTRLFIRVFKAEKQMELWGGNHDGSLALIKTYAIAAASGRPGPKRQAGDMQVPEGVYRIARFNPHSAYHRSLGLNYPNSSDRILGVRGRLGSDVYIHGNHVSAGCMAMTDSKIEEIYFLASHARGAIPVYIFPCKMSAPTYRTLEVEYPQYASFWRELKPIYDAFEARHTVLHIAVSRHGDYILKS
jgi:murein L,D-transpeptidase YafK